MMFMNGVTFLTTLSRYIRMFTSVHFKSLTYPIVSSSLKKRTRLYEQGGFMVILMLMGMGFEIF